MIKLIHKLSLSLCASNKLISFLYYTYLCIISRMHVMKLVYIPQECYVFIKFHTVLTVEQLFLNFLNKSTKIIGRMLATYALFNEKILF